MNLDMQHVPAEEQQGIERLLLSGHGYLAFDGKIRQEMAYMVRTDFRTRDVSDIREKPSHPCCVALLSPKGLVLQSQNFPILAQNRGVSSDLTVTRADSRF